jgi:hypothetical protein
MKKKAAPQPKQQSPRAEREPYEAPAIIYEGLITTSSKATGVPIGGQDGGDSDPANIFNGGG